MIPEFFEMLHFVQIWRENIVITGSIPDQLKQQRFEPDFWESTSISLVNDSFLLTKPVQNRDFHRNEQPRQPLPMCQSKSDELSAYKEKTTSCFQRPYLAPTGKHMRV
jgi:hypothetical protein